MTRTNAYSLVVILVRIGALYMVMRGLSILAPALWNLQNAGALWAMVAGAGVMFAIGGAVWFTADLIARAALASPHEPQFESDLDVRQWQYVLFSAIGLWWAVSGLIDLIWAISSLLQWRAHSGMLRIGGEQLVDLIAGVVQIVVGLALLLGGRGLSNLLHRLRGG